MEEAGQMIKQEEIDETERLLLFGNESEFIMLPEYSNNRKARHYREQALDNYQSIYDPQTMDAMVPYVAINFFDRVISKLREPPKVLGNKQENLTLFIISCHSISRKLRKNNYDIYKFLFRPKMKFGNKEEMEMNILNALDCKMKQTVPFCFVPYFLHYLTLPPGFTRLPVNKIIVWTQADIRFTKFRPSTVAASAILCASKKLFPDYPNDFTSVILSRYAHFDSTIKDELAECVDMIQTTYQNKMNSIVIAKGLINDGAGTSQPLNLAPDEASTAPSSSGKEIVEEGSQRHGKETVAEEASEAVTGIHTVPEQSSSPANGQESLEEGARRQGKGSVTEETSEAVTGIQTVPEQSPSPADGQETLKEGAHRQRKGSVTEEASEAVTGIQTVPEQSSSPGNGRESPVRRSHRPGKEPIDEESSEPIGKKQTAPKQSSYTSADDPEGVKKGFCRSEKMPMAEMEKPELAADNLLMNFELGWDDQNPYSHGYGMCSLCNALARCQPISISEAREQTLECLRVFWEWLLDFGVIPG